jgi:DNA-binding transcriptional ArsR family regulator
VPRWRTDRVDDDGTTPASRSRRKHLSVLKLAGLVSERREGRQTHYSAQPQGLKPLIDWMSLQGAFWRDRFDRLEQNRMDQ